MSKCDGFEGSRKRDVISAVALDLVITSSENSIIYQKEVNMGKSKQNSTFEPCQIGDLIDQTVITAKVNPQKTIIVDSVESNDVKGNRSMTDSDLGGATSHGHTPKDRNNCSDTSSFQTVPAVNQLKNDHGCDIQRSALHKQALENLEDASCKDSHSCSHLEQMPLKHSVVDEITLRTSPPMRVCLVKRITEQHVTTDAGDTHMSSPSMTCTASGNEHSGKPLDVERGAMERRMDESKERPDDGGENRSECSGGGGGGGITLTSQHDPAVSVSDALSTCDTIHRLSSHQMTDTQSGDASEVPHTSSSTKLVTSAESSIDVTKSPEIQEASVSCVCDTLSTMSDTVGVSPTNDSLSDSDCVTDTVSSDVDILPNCDGDNSNTKNVNTRCVNVENVNGCRLNTDSVNPVDKRCSHLSQYVSVLTQSDSDDAVLSSTTKSVAPLHTSDTADVTVTHVIAPVCDTIVSVRAVTMTTADDIAEVDAASMCMSSTVANSTTPPVNAVTSDNVTSSLVRPTTHDQSDVSDCATSSHHGPDLIISSSKITKRKCVGSEPVVIKREKLDTGYDKATAGSQGRVSSKATARSQRQGGRRQGQVSRSQGQVSRGQGQVSRGHVQVMSQPVTTLNPASAPHLARHLMQGIVGKESLSKLGRPPVKTVTLRMLPSAGHVTATSDAAQVGYPVWKRTQAVAASKSDTFVIMTQSVGSSQTPVPFTAVARPYVLVTTSATSVVRPQFIQSQPKIQTVTIVPATSAPPRGRLKQLSVPSVPYGRSKALSRPNSVPTYKCPMPPLELFNEEPPKTFICGECHDTFYHERSLQQHLNRKSVSIRIHCIACKTQLLFYNHCAFLMHVRSHRRGSLDTFGLHRAKITPLPQHFMPAVYWSVSNSDPGSAPVSRAAQTTDSSPVVSSASATPQPERSTTPRTKHDAVEKSPDSKTPFMCIECHSTYTSQGQLQHHLAVKVGQKLYHCNRCPMVMRNPCRYNAHVRVHRKQRPYVCPECGELIRGSHAVFLKHVKWRCLHFTRTVRFTCTHNCNAHFESELRYINHVVAKHVSNYYKCLSCPMAFCTDDAFDKHNVAVHASTAVMQHIIKCSYCDTVYQRHTELTTHMTKSHQTELWGLMHYVFKCPHCKHVRATKYDLIKHMETAHEFTYMLSMCNVCGQEMAGRLLATHKSECHPFDDTKKEQFQWQCNKCSESFPSSARLHKHRRVHNGNAHNTLFTHKSPDGDKSSDEVNSETNSKFAEPTPEFCCSLCSENFSKQTELTSHLRAKHDIIPQFPCHLCGLTYENEADTKRHIADVHEGKKAVAPPTFTCWLCSDDDDASRHFKKRRGLINHLSTVHRIPKNNLDIARLSSSLSDSSGAEGSTEAIPPPAPALKRLKTDSDSKFVCAKCDFSGVDRATFVKHIVKHRALDNPWQCHECALCFTSRPSLRRHLFMVHRVRDFKRYSREAGIDLDVPVVDIKEEEDDELMCGTFVRPTLPPPMQTVVAPAGVDNPLECTVCYKQFDEESAKRAHMRTHGMAFIYSRRRATKPVQ